MYMHSGMSGALLNCGKRRVMSKKLDEIRVEIDSIDNQMHDLLMRRAALSVSVGEEKKAAGMRQIIHPVREAQLVQRLHNRTKEPLSPYVVSRIWREIITASAALQMDQGRRFRVAVSTPPPRDSSVRPVLSGMIKLSKDELDSAWDFRVWDLARDYFGSDIEMEHYRDPARALKRIRDGACAFGVFPYPEDTQGMTWWGMLFDQKEDEKLSIIQALPVYDCAPWGGALVVARDDFVPFAPSGNDVSFIGLEIRPGFERESLDKAGLSLRDAIFSSFDDREIYIMQAEGFLTDESEEPVRLREALGDHCRYCSVLGGYPAFSRS